MAAGGEQSQHLYLLQSSSISEFRLDYMDYTQTNLQTNFDTKGVKAGTSGQVYSVNESDYISVYDAQSSELSILQHNSSMSKFSPLTFSNGYISFGSNANANNNSSTIGTDKSDGTKTSNSTSFSSPIGSSSAVPTPTLLGEAKVKPRKSATASSSTNLHNGTTIAIQGSHGK